MLRSNAISREKKPFFCRIIPMSMAKTARQEVGKIGEDIASRFLEKKGFKILERNFRRPYGEIDIIAEKAEIVRFVEVKTVTREMGTDFSREMGDYRPEEQVHPAKLRKIAMTAESYMAGKNDAREYQIDVVAVFLDQRGRKAHCRLYEQVL